jgi:hypothetical protein
MVGILSARRPDLGLDPLVQAQIVPHPVDPGVESWPAWSNISHIGHYRNL